MIPKKIMKNVRFFAINLWVLIANEFMITFCHKLMPKNCINLCKKTDHFFMIPKKIIKNVNFFAINLWVLIANKFMITFCHKLMPKNCINLCKKTYHFL